MVKITVHIALFFCVTYALAEVQNTRKRSYDPARLLSEIFNSNETLEARQRGYGLVNFENPGVHDLHSGRDQRPLRFEEENYAPYYSYNNGKNPIKFKEDQGSDLNNGQITFQDDNQVYDEGNMKRKKRKRRRKPKNGALPYPGLNFNPGYQGSGFQGPNQGGYGSSHYPGYPIESYRPPHHPRPRPSLASEALSSVIEALTSIARYDDYQCVPRLLCEAAGGGSLGSSGLLQSIAGIQPLLTMLSAYNGISTSPLFVFGRAVFLGMTSKGNTGTCRYAYPQCPTDPEDLIYYLNNYNGGFFRFFSAPQNPLPPQNLEQFYNQLSQQQGYPTSPNQGYPGYPDPNGQGYSPPHPNPYDQHNQPSLYNNQNYGSNYAYDYNYGDSNRIRFKDNDARIEKRIQNRPYQNLIDDSFEEDDYRSTWHFPDDSNTGTHTSYGTKYDDHNVRGSRTMRFPDGSQTYHNQNDYRKGKVINFPPQRHYQNSNYHYNNDRPHTFTTNRYETTTYSYNDGQQYQNNYNNHQNNKYPNYYSENQGIKYYNYNQNPNNNQNYQSQNHYNDRPDYSNYINNNYHNNNYNQQEPYNDNQNYYNVHQNMYSSNNQKYTSTVFNNEEYIFDHKHNFYVKKENFNNNVKRSEADVGLKTVYVVRGHGDPNRPEIVKLKPGQSVH